MQRAGTHRKKHQALRPGLPRVRSVLVWGAAVAIPSESFNQSKRIDFCAVQLLTTLALTFS